MSRHLIAAAVVVASLGGVRVAAADDKDKADCSFIEFNGSAGPASIDADLKVFEKKLKKPPFSAWTVFKVLTKLDKTLVKQKSETLTLKSGVANVINRERTPTRINLGLTLDGADGKRVLDSKPDVNVGDWLFVGTNANNDGHFLAIMCK
jgi:hypothetical protein